MSDYISRQAAIDAIQAHKHNVLDAREYDEGVACGYAAAHNHICDVIAILPSAQPEQRYTEEELRVFQHGISLSLLSKRSSQHWQYDEDTATEIKFLERLYEKVGADIRSEHDG